MSQFTRTALRSSHLCCTVKAFTCIAESPLLVLVVVGGGGTPHPAIRAFIFGALRVRLLHEREGEHARLALICHWDTKTKTSTTFFSGPKHSERKMSRLYCRQYLVGRDLPRHTASVRRPRHACSPSSWPC